MGDGINLDVHAIADLQKRNLPPTDDKPKYNYTSDSQGNYSKQACMLSEITSCQ